MWGELRQKQPTLTICAGCPVALRKLGVVSGHVALFLALVLSLGPFLAHTELSMGTDQTCLPWERSL